MSKYPTDISQIDMELTNQMHRVIIHKALIIGKTETMIKYSKSHCDENFNNFIWLNAETESSTDS